MGNHVFSARRDCYQAKLTPRWCSERINITSSQMHSDINLVSKLQM